MSTPQGWYDSGTPGRQRWGDGAQWTAHERETPPTTPAMGWYQVQGTTDVRWWDGAMWTPYRVRKGKPRPDALAVEPPAMGLVLGIVFLVLGLMQVTAAVITQNPGNFVLPVLLTAVGALWLCGAAYSRAIRRLPVPQSAPVVDAVVRPLPGEVDGPDAGWYPMTRQASRWWTGSQWSWYLGTRFGVRPGHAGPRGYLVSMIAGWCVTAIAVLGAIVAVVAGFMEQGPVTLFLIVFGIAFAVIMGALGAFALLLTRSRRNALLLPTTPPPLR
ncbi:DUF2510 domain-containing protein [Microbacterium sp.]|uniref:DUF2510 domain-containing protein n=1 Tax=Microbacterium sp. TaxID=51671 RepID=UPI00289D01BA|nr:DUF2510 domain-containing protein [Microbacterium sp.]